MRSESMFDKNTLDYYERNFDTVYHNYEKAVLSEFHEYLLESFPEKKSAILDIGAGSGRDMRFLLQKGYDVYGIDGSLRLVEKAVASNPELFERLVHSYIPEKNVSHPVLSRKYDGILLSAVLMHIPRAHLFDAVYFIKSRMQENGRLVVSLPLERNDVKNERDQQGRLFSDYKPAYIQTFLERAGFRFIGEKNTSDGLGRGFSWTVMLFELEKE